MMERREEKKKTKIYFTSERKDLSTQPGWRSYIF